MTLERPYRIREGTTHNDQTDSDLFFVTLEKTEEKYSPTTMYRDYAVSPELFHWESQSVTSQASPTGQRHINHRQRDSNILLFVRRTAKMALVPRLTCFWEPQTTCRTNGNARSRLCGGFGARCRPISSETPRSRQDEPIGRRLKPTREMLEC